MGLEVLGGPWWEGILVGRGGVVGVVVVVVVVMVVVMVVVGL